MGLSFKNIANIVHNPFSVVEDTVQWVKDAVDHPEHVANRANEAAEKAIQEQNEYNTPANQVQRLLDAGLNPNLFYKNVDTGNQTSTANYQTGDKASSINSILGYAFNAAQLMNSVTAARANAAAQLAQAQHNADVLSYQKQQSAVSNALRQQELAYRQTRDDREYKNWVREFDERVRHNKAMENAPKGGLYGLLERTAGAFLGRPVTDIATDAGNFMRKAPLGVLNPNFFRISGKALSKVGEMNRAAARR